MKTVARIIEEPDGSYTVEVEGETLSERNGTLAKAAKKLASILKSR